MKPQSAIRYPLNNILGNQGLVRLLRELFRHGGALSAPDLVRRTALTTRTVSYSLSDLISMGVVDQFGSRGTRLYGVTKEHPLHKALHALFAAEEERFNQIIEAVRQSVQPFAANIVAVWIYGSVARGEDKPTSDLDIVIICKPHTRRVIEAPVREAMDAPGARLRFVASVVVVDTGDIRQLNELKDPWWQSVLNDGIPVMGELPGAFTST